jgi:glycosyltransferase involved in cell wall biosynthesis
MIRVMLLCTDLQRGGLPLRLARLAPLLREHGIQPIVGCLAPAGPLSVELTQGGIETFSCDARTRFDLSCLLRLSGHIRAFNPDLIHASLFHANLAARLVGRLDRQRPIITSTVTIEVERPSHRWLESLTAPMSDVHVANSEAVARHLVGDLGFPPEKVVTILNGIDIAAVAKAQPIDRKREGVPPDVKLVVWAGRMDPVKDLGTLLNAFARARDNVNACLVLLGDGPERSRVESRIARLKLQHEVRLAGWREDTLSWFKAADAFLFTSLTEGSPNALIEAMACGCPVIASDLPSIRELIEKAQGWTLVSPRNIDEFASKLRKTLESGRKHEANQSAASFLQTYDTGKIAMAWARLYHQLAAGSHN